MNATDIIQRWRERQAEILASLPPALLLEYRDLEVAIRVAEGTLGQIDPPAPTAAPSAVPVSALEPPLAEPRGPAEAGADGTAGRPPRRRRTPLARRKRDLAAFLAARGGATRTDILAGTDIPPGSLSTLLQDGDFVHGDDGLWRARPAAGDPVPGADPAVPVHGSCVGAAPPGSVGGNGHGA